MFRHLSGPIVKALFSGFFCCLCASANNAKDPMVQEGASFALRVAHPQNTQILKMIQAEGVKPPLDYSVYQMRSLDLVNGRIEGETPIVLGNDAIVSASHIDQARAIKAKNSIHISLSKEGGKRLSKTTGQMALGRDRIGTILKDKCIITPYVQAVLNCNLVISGLKDADETQRVTKALDERRKK
ncbi:MAG: hypothetical protein ABF380_06195 [Akkermansiaceae bacterium]